MIISPSNHENTIICKLNKLNEYIYIYIMAAACIYMLDLVHDAAGLLVCSAWMQACDDEPVYYY
jgi:hypothetical protein